jgi:hypothetical protein
MNKKYDEKYHHVDLQERFSENGNYSSMTFLLELGAELHLIT